VRTARAFLAGYLAFLYGHRGASAITGATPMLRRHLASQVLVVAPAQRRRYGRAIELTATVVGGGWSVQVLIADGGVADYPLLLEITRAGGRWLVSGVGG
jgi:citrate lyase alpha subunit